jgi:AcrR family transcriptional regulator
MKRPNSATPAGEEAGSTRQRLLDFALELFAAHGFAGTSMRLLARTAGLRESSIYNHFAGKDELYKQVIGQWGPVEFVERLRSAEYQTLGGDPAAFFRLCGIHLIERWMDPREHLFAAMIAREGPDSPGRRNYDDALLRVEIELLAGYITGFARDCGVIAPDASETARMFVGGLTHIRRARFSDPANLPQRAEVEEAMSRYIENFIATVVRTGQ